MTDDERTELAERWRQVHVELQRLEDLKVHHTHEPLVDFGKREADLLGELDEIEGLLGEAWLADRRRERDTGSR
jgi:hypothetical protein